ncbi:hypothetical protein JG687_00003069 [Phytophthora cactorum]|uniref:Uncharacterized protein n=1 Tax=Phytophthora cactorum TaxID=29920 RepID=A0A8T1USN7_9STRA|nr:hypothetical protein JG687_00003069 [Phytophthora cactorum]
MLPSRRILGGRLLKEHAKRWFKKAIEALRTMQTNTEGRVNLSSDVWMNIAKVHLLGVQLTLFGVALTYVLPPAGDHHDRLAIAEELEKIMKKALNENRNTDNASQCARARRISALRWPQMIFMFCFAHDVNNLVKAILRSTFRESALQMLYRQYKTDDDFPTCLHVWGDTAFWSKLKSAEAVIAPLSYASYRLQREENTCGAVQDSVRREELVKCIEHRWSQCEQPLFMLGYALHPAYYEHARELPSTVVSEVGVLPKIAVYYYRRLFATEDVGFIWSDMFTWMRGTYTRAKPNEIEGGPWEYWQYMTKEKPNSLLPQLAIAVLSVAVNTATCVWRFCELGQIHSALRHRVK